MGGPRNLPPIQAMQAPCSTNWATEDHHRFYGICFKAAHIHVCFTILVANKQLIPIQNPISLQRWSTLERQKVTEHSAVLQWRFLSQKRGLLVIRSRIVHSLILPEHWDVPYHYYHSRVVAWFLDLIYRLYRLFIKVVYFALITKYNLSDCSNSKPNNKTPPKKGSMLRSNN